MKFTLLLALLVSNIAAAQNYKATNIDDHRYYVTSKSMMTPAFASRQASRLEINCKSPKDRIVTGGCESSQDIAGLLTGSGPVLHEIKDVLGSDPDKTIGYQESWSCSWLYQETLANKAIEKFNSVVSNLPATLSARLKVASIVPASVPIEATVVCESPVN